ncbi:hypothetical protein D9M71_215350 [compost metagenome]
MVRISFCAVSTSLTRTGPLASRSSRSNSAARLDMFLKILSLTRSSAPLSDSTNTSDDTSRNKAWMPRSSTSERLLKTNMRSSICSERSPSISRIASINWPSIELSRKFMMSAARLIPPRVVRAALELPENCFSRIRLSSFKAAGCTVLSDDTRRIISSRTLASKWLSTSPAWSGSR